MFKTYMVLLDPGETENGGGSPTDAETTGGDPNSDSSSEHSQDSDAKGADDNEEKSASPQEAMRKVVAEIVKKSESQTENPDEEEGGVKGSDNTDAEEEPKGDDTTESSSDDNKGPVPYKRFEEVNSLKSKLESQVKEWEPLVQAQQRNNEVLNKAGVTLEEYQDTIEFLTLVRRDPKAALAKIQPLYEALTQFDEKRLPKEFQDKIDRLDARVKEGEMSEEAANELRELYTAQGKLAVASKADKVKSAASQADQEKELIKAYTDAASSWGKAKMASDPDYKPKTDKDATDGIFELTEAKFTQLLASRPIRSPQDVTAYLEEAYNSAKKFFVSRKTATKPTPSSSKAVNSQKQKPKSLYEMASVIAASHGVQYTPRT